jgi:2-phosphosulfolactate phosphatase
VIVHVYLTSLELGDAAFRGKPAVAIDVLRASTSIAYAQEGGAEKVIPTASIEAAKRLAATLDDQTAILCGEREGKPINGFHLGNSPREFTRDAVLGKTLIMTTTNGTDTIVRLEGAREIVVCSFVNVTAVARHLKDEPEIFVCCSGQTGRFSLEDTVCAGLLVARLREIGVRNLDLDDGAMGAEALHQLHRSDILRCLMGASHGRYLLDLGFGEDIAVCARVDALAVVPVVREGRIA